MALNLNLLALDRSRCSDKSSDSGSLLDLSSRAGGGNEDTWLFDMEAKMKDMELIEEEEIPDDLLDISLEESVNDEDSLNCPTLLDVNSSPTNDHQVVGLPSSAYLANEPLIPSSSSGPTSDPQALLEDFGFNIKFSPALTDKDLPSVVAKDDGGSSKKTAESPTILEDFGFNVGSSASLKGESIPTATHREDELTLQPTPSSTEGNTDAQNLLDDFGFDTNLQSSHKGEAVPNEKSVVMPLTSLPSTEQHTNAQNLLDDFGFETNLPAPMITKVSPNTQNTNTGTSSSEQCSGAQNLLADIGFDTKLSATTTCTPPSKQATRETQNLLDDFGFDTKQSAPNIKHDSYTPDSLERSTTTDAQTLLDDFGFDTQSSATHTVADLSVSQTTPHYLEEGKDKAQSLLDDFGFDSAPHPTKESLPNTHACTVVDSLLTPLSSSSSSGASTSSQNLLDDFGFDINLSAPSSAKELANPHHVADMVSSSSLPHSVVSSSAVKPVQPDVPLIAFSDDVVRLWQTKEEEKSDSSPSKSTSDDKNGCHVQTYDGDYDLEGSEKQGSCTEIEEGTMAQADNSGEIVEGEVVDVVERKNRSRLQTPSKKLTKCSSFLRSPVKCSQLEEMKEKRNLTFDIRDISLVSPTWEQDNVEVGVQPSSSDGLLRVMRSNVTAAETLHHRNDSLSSEHSQASSISSTLSTTSKESRGEQQSGVETGTGSTRRLVGRLTKPTSKSRPTIKASLLPSKSATTLSKAPGAVTKMPPPNSRLMKPKSLARPTTSVKNGWIKPSDTKLSTSRLGGGLTSKPSRLTKMASSSSVAIKQPAGQTLRSQPRSKLAVHAALKKRKVVGTENPPVKKVPLPSSTSVTISESTGTEVTSPKSGSGVNDTFTVSTTATSPSAGENVTPKTTKRGRRSFIPTPSQENKVQRRKQIRGVGGRVGVGGVSSRVFQPRNGPNHSNGYGPAKPKGYSFDFDRVTDVPPFGASKVVHSPLDKENLPATPHSKWSPIRRKKPLNFEEACIRCTKKVK